MPSPFFITIRLFVASALLMSPIGCLCDVDDKTEAFCLEALEVIPETVPMPELIRVLSGYEVFDWQDENEEWLQRVGQGVLDEANKEPIKARRINEVGNQVENLVLKVIEDMGGSANRPKAASGKIKAAGYPDLWVEGPGFGAYLELKTFSAHTKASSQRTFYVSPSDDFKVTRDAYHLLLGFSTRKVAEDEYVLEDFYWVDLYHLNCRVKIEFNASNKDLYPVGGDMKIVSSEGEGDDN